MDINSQFRTKISYMQEEITHMQQVFLYGESNMLKTSMTAYTNQMNKDVLQLPCSTELTLQVHNLSLCSLKASDLDFVKFCLGLRSYFLALFLEELAPII